MIRTALATGCVVLLVAACRDPSGRELGAEPDLVYWGDVDGDVVHVEAPDRAGWAGVRVLVTGFDSGADQGSLLLRDDSGATLQRYQVSGATPYRFDDGAPLIQAQVAHPKTLRWIGSPGDTSPALGFATYGSYSPSSWVLLERTGDGSLEERTVVWNVGHLEDQVVLGDCFLLSGVDGRTRSANVTYAKIVVAVDLANARSGTASRTVVLPVDIADGDAAPAPLLWFARLPLDHPLGDRGGTFVEKDRPPVLRFESGLQYTFDVATGDVRVSADERYRDAWWLRKRQQPEAPEDVDAHLAQLAARVRVHRAAR